MKKVMIFGEEVTVYNEDDIINKTHIISYARQFWHDKTQEYVQKNGDVGTCVLGAGIEIYFMYPRARKPKKLMIINQPRCAQGSICWEDSVKEVITYLKENGLEANYNCGFMD